MQGVGSSQKDSQRAFSVLDRLLITHPVWLQLSLNQDTALYILLREPVGTFLVRKCSSSQRKVLCFRVTAEKSASSVKECFICEEDSTFALESSALSFPDLCRLVAFYCISRDVLPLPLELPDAIAMATTHKQLEGISHMGQDFWNAPTAAEIQNGPVDPIPSTSSGSQVPKTLTLDQCTLLTRGKQGKLCFINPLFLQLEVARQPQLVNHSASNKRHRFKRSMRLRLSESSMNLSLEGIGSYSPPSSLELPGQLERLHKTGTNQQRRVHPGAGVLRRTPAVSPGSADEEDTIAVYVQQTSSKVEDPSQPHQAARGAEPGTEVTALALERRPAPSLAELDSSSSFSSMDEDNDSDSEPESMARAQTHMYPRPPLVRSRGRGGLHRMSEAFVCFFAPDKRLTRLVEDLSRDRRSVFGGMVQDFVLAQREVLKSMASSSSSSSSRVTSVQLLQGLRLFLSQAKCCLLDSGELEPPIETLVPENEKDLALERAMFSCVLRPLRSCLDKALVELHNQDGSSQRLNQNLLQLKGDAAMERLGVRTGVPDSREVERVKQKLILMQRTHSPIDKVLLLLQVCKCVHKAMGSLHGHEVSWDDFLPSLSYVIVECNRPHILIEVEYMMELLEPSWLGGEGGYYLTSVYASLCLIQSLDKDQPISACLTPEAQEALKEWSSRRSREAQRQKENQQNQRCVRILFQDGERSAVRTLQWNAGETSQALAQLCASTFGVSDPQQYTLYWRSGGEMRALPPQAQPQDLASHSEGGPSLSYLRTDHDFSKMRRLTRGGAVDLSESVCEE
ncbi:ras and Rab interactor 3 isoform X1 [Notolabrus celidotus]|uniref:ras and Rab interactor 3 isoform X1 n=1 Tax=Notolabrus celidotus TaxID=1203425 RepID=UPI00148F949C|nr:ras and Rab interactor 3 isoform X1 [Notolabrus celidotus]XP_034532084.1 ras and Rab interactor 3 isoform X1 [Notolabrus celidotus]